MSNITCKFCSKSFKAPQGRATHEKHCNSPNKIILCCLNCQKGFWWSRNLRQVWTTHAELMEYANFMSTDEEDDEDIQELFQEIDFDSMSPRFFFESLYNWEDWVHDSVKDMLTYRGWKVSWTQDRYGLNLQDTNQIHPEGQISITLTKDNKKIQLTNISEYSNVGEGDMYLVAETAEELQEALNDFGLS